MSIAALKWAFRLPIDGPAKAVLLALADHAHDDDDTCFPKLDRIQHWAGIRLRAVRMALDKLVAWGLVTIEKRDQYVLHVGAHIPDDARDAAKPARDAKRKVHEVPKKVHEVQNSVHLMHPYNDNPQLTPNEAQAVRAPPKLELVGGPTPNQPSKPHKAKRGQVPLDLPLPSWVPAEAWADFVQHRVDKKNPLTELAAKRLIKLMAGWHQRRLDVEAAITTSIVNGWTGIFEPKPLQRAPEKGRSVMLGGLS